MFWKVCASFELLLIVLSVIAAVPVITNDNEYVINEKETTNIEFTKLRYVWNIKNLHMDDFILGQKLNSSTFPAATTEICQWYLFLSPKGFNIFSKDYVSIFLYSVSCNENANVKISFLNANNEKINEKEYSHHFLPTRNFGYPKFVKQDFFLNEENGIFVNNSITILCEVGIISTGQHTSEKPKQLPWKDDLGKDLAILLDNELFSDVKISSGGKDFPAHKNILAARSPFFKSKFEQDAQERISVPDMSDDVLMEMLRYIYTGEVSNLNDLAPSLLVAADKYQLVGLKTICENYMSANLTIENAIEYYTLGDTKSAAFLKSQAKAFIVAHTANIIPTSGFKSALEKNPVLLDGIFSNKNQNNL